MVLMRGGVSFIVVVTFVVFLFFAGGHLWWDRLQFQSRPSLLPTQHPMQSPFASNEEELQNTIHPYSRTGVDVTKTLNNIHIIGVVFIPRDIERSIPDKWFLNLDFILKNVATLYTREFQNMMDITYQVIPHLVRGDSDTETYTPETLVIEAEEKTDSFKDDQAYNVWMIYFVRDEQLTKNLQGGSLGGLAEYQAATQFEFWLDDEAIYEGSQYGLQGSAHEFGHALGIPHPWDLPANIKKEPRFGNVLGDVMGYNTQGVPFEKLFIREDVKREMGLIERS